MEITRETAHGSWVVLVVRGHVDHDSAPRLEEACRTEIARDGCSLALDLSAVTYVSSAGLRAILVVAKELGPHHARLALVGATATVREAFEVSGFSRYLPQVDSLDKLT